MEKIEKLLVKNLIKMSENEEKNFFKESNKNE